MHCLYCDRPLALIKRLTGDGEFCSKECRKNYQREHNQLALARLLETQPPKAPAKAVPAKSKPAAAAPVSQPRVTKPQERAPEPAGFFTEFPTEAVVGSDSLSFTGSPRFAEPPPAYRKGQSKLESKERGASPRTARFKSDSFGPRSFAGALRAANSLAFKLSPALPASGEAMARCQPGGAGSVSQQPPARNYSGAASRSAAPQFRLRAVAEPAPIVCGTAIRPARFIPVFAVAQSVAGAIRLSSVQPRWKPLQPVLAERMAGKIVFVLGSFLRRPVRPADVDGLPEIFEIPLRPVSFPPSAPGMACLEERMHRTDRIGFSPP